jgi:hypothetical protein
LASAIVRDVTNLEIIVSQIKCHRKFMGPLALRGEVDGLVKHSRATLGLSPDAAEMPICIRFDLCLAHKTGTLRMGESMRIPVCDKMPSGALRRL